MKRSLMFLVVVVLFSVAPQAGYARDRGFDLGDVFGGAEDVSDIIIDQRRQSQRERKDAQRAEENARRDAQRERKDATRAQENARRDAQRAEEHARRDAQKEAALQAKIDLADRNQTLEERVAVPAKAENARAKTAQEWAEVSPSAANKLADQKVDEGQEDPRIREMEVQIRLLELQLKKLQIEKAAGLEEATTKEPAATHQGKPTDHQPTPVVR